MEEFLKEIKRQAGQAAEELLEKARLSRGDILVVGCSSSEVAGERIGTASSLKTAEAVFEGIYKAALEKGIYLAAQCCEHLNRAIIIERELAARERIPSKDSFTPSYPRLRRETVMVDMSMGRSGERTPGNSRVP